MQAYIECAKVIDCAYITISHSDSSDSNDTLSIRATMSDEYRKKLQITRNAYIMNPYISTLTVKKVNNDIAIKLLLDTLEGFNQSFFKIVPLMMFKVIKLGEFISEKTRWCIDQQIIDQLLINLALYNLLFHCILQKDDQSSIVNLLKYHKKTSVIEGVNIEQINIILERVDEITSNCDVKSAESKLLNTELDNVDLSLETQHADII